MTLTPTAIRYRQVLAWLAAIAALAWTWRAGADDAVSVRHDGAVYVVSATATVAADPATAWQVLSGYDAYAGFVPGLHESRTVERAGRHAIVQQRGEFRFMGLGLSLEVRYLVTERWPESIHASAIAGSFRTAEGRYELSPVERGTRVVYTGRLEPDFYVPPFVGTRVIQASAAEQFAAMVAEIERRHSTLQSRSRAYASMH